MTKLAGLLLAFVVAGILAFSLGRTTTPRDQVSQAVRDNAIATVETLELENEALRRAHEQGDPSPHLLWVARSVGARAQLLADLVGSAQSGKAFGDVTEAAAAANVALASYGEGRESPAQVYDAAAKELTRLREALEAAPLR